MFYLSIKPHEVTSQQIESFILVATDARNSDLLQNKFSRLRLYCSSSSAVAPNMTAHIECNITDDVRNKVFLCPSGQTRGCRKNTNI